MKARQDKTRQGYMRQGKTAIALSILMLSLSTTSFAGDEQTFNLHATSPQKDQDLTITCFATTDVAGGKYCAGKDGTRSHTFSDGPKNFYLIDNQSGSRIMTEDASCTPLMKGSSNARSPDGKLASFDIYVTVTSQKQNNVTAVLFSHCSTKPNYVPQS